MHSDAIPELLYPVPKKQDRYVVVRLDAVDVPVDLATAIKSAETLVRMRPKYTFAVCKLDTTVALINGIISVRAES